MRARLRHDASGSPQNTFNRNGDATYSFDTGVAPTRSFPTEKCSSDTYDFSLSAFDSGGEEPARTDIQIIAGSGGAAEVPAPGTPGLLGIGLAGLGFARRRSLAQEGSGTGYPALGGGWGAE